MNDLLLVCFGVLLVLAGVGAGANLIRSLLGECVAAQREHAQRRTEWSVRGDTPVQRRSDGRAERLVRAALLTAGLLPVAHVMGQDQVRAPGKDPVSDSPQGRPSDSVKLAGETSLLLQGPVVAAEPEPLVLSTDRPGFSDSTGIVPAGHLQLETGYTFTFRSRDGAEMQRHNGPEILARVGLIDDRFEIRLITSGYVWSRSDDGSGGGFASSHGWSDVSLGLKVKVLDQGGWLPRLAVGAQSTLGAGSDSASSQTAEPTLKLLWSNDLGESLGDDWKGVTLGGNANIAWPTTDGDRFTQGQGSVFLSFPLADRLTGYVQYYVIGPNAKGTDAAHYAETGGALLLNSRTQLDARIGFGLNQAADNVYCGFGLSVLF